MAHLITSHDPYHLHKILGLIVLLSYIYRYSLLLATGSAFPTSSVFDVCSVIVHGLLSWSSLLLPLPKTRNFASPMIWPEFRLHSILFATRHVVCTLASLSNLWPNNIIKDGVVRANIILGTVHLASLITAHNGDCDKRTTNSMPYPPEITAVQQVLIKKWYTLSQFGATISCLMNDASINFAPLLAIQMAPLLMTLVRKGKITTRTYHRVYSVSLFMGYLVVCTRLLLLFKPGFEGTYNVDKEDNDKGVRRLAYTIRATILYKSLKVPMNLRNYTSAKGVWLMVVPFAMIIHPLLSSMLSSSYFTANIPEEEQGEKVNAFEVMLRRLILLGIVRTVTKQAFIYAPLFGYFVAVTNINLSPNNCDADHDKTTILSEQHVMEKLD